MKENRFDGLYTVYTGQGKNDYPLEEAGIFLDGNKLKIGFAIPQLSQNYQLTFHSNLGKAPHALWGKVKKGNGMVSYHLYKKSKGEGLAKGEDDRSSDENL